LIELAQDFQDLLIELADADAEFVVVGGYAVAFHGHVRATKDLDVFVRATRENAEKVYRALAEFGAPLEHFDVTVGDFSGYGGVLQIGLPPRRIDIISKVSGITFEDAIDDKRSFELDGRRIPVIGLEALVKNKTAAGRAQDLADVESLEKERKT